MRTHIRDIAYCLPEQVVSNADLRRENPHWDFGRVEERTGVFSRHIAAADQTALDLGLAATRKLLAAQAGLREQLDAIVFCTQSPDYIMPPNSCLLHGLLELPERVLACDITLACSGYPYALALSRGLIDSGMARNVLVVTADTYSRYIHKQDRSARVLFGDGAAASWLAPGEDEGGILDIQCGTAGRHYDKFIIPAGACRTPSSAQTRQSETDASGNVRTPEHIHMDGMSILSFVNSSIPRQIRTLLERNQRRIEDVDLFIFHQASKMALDSLEKLLKIPPHKVYRNIATMGNTVSASIPIAIKDALADGALRPGALVVLCGFGVGLSLGSVLVKW